MRRVISLMTAFHNFTLLVRERVIFYSAFYYYFELHSLLEFHLLLIILQEMCFHCFSYSSYCLAVPSWNQQNYNSLQYPYMTWVIFQFNPLAWIEPGTTISISAAVCLGLTWTSHHTLSRWTILNCLQKPAQEAKDMVLLFSWHAFA